MDVEMTPGSAAIDVASLSLLSLRVELQRRGLSTAGCRTALQGRLSDALKREDPLQRPRGETYTARAISVPTSFSAGRQTVAVERRPRTPPALPTPEHVPDAGDAAGTGADQTGTRARCKRSAEEAGKGSSEDVVDVGETTRAEKRPRSTAVGYYMGSAVWVTDESDMSELWDVADGYGKGSLSRSEPMYALLTTDAGVMKNGRAARQLLAIERAAAVEAKENNDSISKTDRRGVEHLQLSLVEAFHAAFTSNLLRIVTHDGSAMEDVLTTWNEFCTREPHFPARYAAYVSYRKAGWMPRSGLKYGVDWVLYRAGAKRHSHSPYCVVLTFDDTGLEKTWIRLQNKLRLVKNVAKSLVIARLYLPTAPTARFSTPQEAVADLQITELTIDRWVS